MQADVAESGFQIWGADDQIYGPVELPTLVGWVKEERVSAKTWVYSRRDDSWTRAASVPELRMFFQPRAPGGLGGAAATEPVGSGAIKPSVLRRVKILAGMTDEQLAKFVGFMEVQPVRQFAEIVKQGDYGDAMFLVLEGELRVRLMVGGKETTLVTLGPGEFFGEISLFDHGPRSADVVANVDGMLLKISASSFEKLLCDAPDLAAPFLLAIAKTLMVRIRADNKRYRDSINFARTAGR
ncbi:MAG TPA: cyclic nucleotide-binding domain-containing protein [Methylomirabilota bacterium]|nr:cyclic nucleotide-binding domain-containing protein [Methylomirabilota bacterium]